MNKPQPHFQIGELVEVATYIQNDGWHFLGLKMFVTDDDGVSGIVKGNVQTRYGEYWDYYRREHIRSLPANTGL